MENGLALLQPSVIEKANMTERGCQVVYLLGVDIGTTNVKAALFDTHGNRICVVNEGYPTYRPFPGWVEQDPNHWWSATVRTISRLVSTVRVEPERIRAIGLSGHVRSAAILDRDFHPIRNGIVWSDTRTEAECRWLNEKMGHEFINITGNKAATTFSLPQIIWLRNNHPHQYEKISHICTPKEFVIHKLTGVFAGDVSDQSGSLLMDVKKRNWSEQLLSKLELPREWFPPLYESQEVIGEIGAYASKHTGLQEGTPVVAGGGDNSCAAIGSGIHRQGIALIIIGTAGIVLSQLDEPKGDSEARLDLFCNSIPNKWYLIGLIQSAGFSLQWLANRLLEERNADLKPNYQLSSSEWLSTVERRLASIPPGSEGLVFLPYLQGQGSPNRDPKATGVFYGISGAHKNEHLIKATMEGVGFCIRQCMDVLRQRTEINEIRCAGKGVTNKTWLQIVSDILGQPIWTVATDEETSLGAAILAGVGVGIFDTIEEGCNNMVKKGEECTPDDTRVRRFEECYGLFNSISSKLDI